VRTSVLIAGSIVLHLGGFVAISQRSKQIEKRQTLIAMVEQKKKEEEKKPEPPKPIEAPKEVLQPKQLKVSPVAPAPEPVESPAPSPAMAAMPDYGIHASANGPTTGGVGVPEGVPGGRPGGTGDAGAPQGPIVKSLGTQPAGGAKDPDLSADIAAWKPKPTARVKPVYPDEARSSEIEGTVVVEATIDCSGKVKIARVLQGLGHGLDEAALTAIRKTEFEPAERCRAAFQKSMKINYAFRLGD